MARQSIEIFFGTIVCLDDHTWLLFPLYWVANLARYICRKFAVLGALLLTFSTGAGALADLKAGYSSTGSRGSSTRIKRDDAVEKTKSSGYHNPVGSPSREAGDEQYLLVSEEPKTDDEIARRKMETAQLAKILSVLKTGKFTKAQVMLSELASAMPVDSQARACYQRLAHLCGDRMDTEVWYRYDVKEMRSASARQSVADLPGGNSGGVSPTSGKFVQSLRKEAWLLLTAGERN